MSGVRGTQDALRAAPAVEVEPEVGPSRDHRVLGVEAGLFALGPEGPSWSDRGRALWAALAAELRASLGGPHEAAAPLRRVEPCGPRYGLLGGGEHLVEARLACPQGGEAALLALLGGWERLATRLELTVSRVDLGGADVCSPALRAAASLLRPDGPPRLSWHLADRLGRAWPLGRAALARSAEGEELEVRLGSLERLVVLLLEQGGPLPLAVAPEQARVLPVGAAQLPYAAAVAGRLRRAGLRVERPADARGPLPGRVAQAIRARVPRLLIVGAREAATRSVAVRGQAPVDLQTFVEQVRREVTADPYLTRGEAALGASSSPFARAAAVAAHPEPTHPDRQEGYCHRIP